MENLNADQIVKALECCASPTQMCKDCPMPEEVKDDCRCMETISRNALSLIKELTEENERLTSLCTSKDVIIEDLNAENERLRAENETLKVATNDQYAHLCDCYDNIAEMLRQKEAHTVMKMHSMLCEGRVSNDTVVIVANQIAKEILDGKDENT